MTCKFDSKKETDKATVQGWQGQGEKAVRIQGRFPDTFMSLLACAYACVLWPCDLCS